MKPVHTKTSLRITGALLSLLLICSCNSGKTNNQNWTYHLDYGEIFSTAYNIKYSYHESLKKEIENEFERFNNSLNPFNKNSIISKVNRNEPVELDSFFLDLFEVSVEVSRKTEGYFDITTSPLINAWGFGFNNLENPTPEIIDSLREYVGYEKIAVDNNGNISKTDPRVELNTSAIAKGYACDVIARLLESYGIENYMVEIGGEVNAKGVNDKGTCWRIGVDKPIERVFVIQHDLQAILSLCGKSLATSGNYRNYYVKDGKKYTHTIDPHTGYPSETDILSATVLADNCMTADAYATAFVAMGKEKSLEIAKQIPGLHYYFIYDNGPGESFGIIYSDGFEEFLVEEAQ